MAMAAFLTGSPSRFCLRLAMSSSRWVGLHLHGDEADRRKEVSQMWDTVETTTMVLSHDLPCPRCGHGMHTFLACGDGCECGPVVMPGSRQPD
jgi:hypothetical protein